VPRRAARAGLVAALALWAWAAPAVAMPFERVSIPGEDVRLEAILYRPAGPGPHPAVIALHGCSGLFGREGTPSPRHADWGARLAAEGFLVVMPDSFGSRRLGSQCGTSNRRVTPGRERVADVRAARVWLLAQADVKRDAISLLGWSNGGSTVLAAIRRDRAPGDGLPDLARAVAFYPGCRGQAESRSFAARAPLLVLIGEADDWTPPEPCRALALAARSRGEPVEIQVYPGAFHDFDHPGLDPRQRTGLAFTASGNGTAMIGTHPDARADALRRVPAFLAR
jgi:dienelactone hydrolase